MALIASSHDSDGPYGACPVDQEQFISTQFSYPTAFPLYFFDQHIPTKPSLSGYPQLAPAVVSGNPCPTWDSIHEDPMGCLFDQRTSQDSYFSEYSLDQNSDACMAGFPVPMYGLSLPISNTDSVPLGIYQTSPTYFSPSGTPSSDLWYHASARVDFGDYCQIPESISSSPSEDSISPRSIRDCWQVESSSIQYSGDDEGEPLQGLGLYDCPDLTMDEIEGDVEQKRLSFGKGLKLEESFKFEDDDEEEDDEDEDEGVEDALDDAQDWDQVQPISQAMYGQISWS